MMNTGSKFRQVLEQVLREQAKPAHKYGHQPRLYALCQDIGQGVPHDDDIVFAAAWLHDLGVFEGNRPLDQGELEAWDHVAYARAETTRILAQTDFPHSKIAGVIQVIEEHQPHNEPHLVESVIVRDADILEQLGAIGVLRTAAKLGSDTRFLAFEDAAQYLERQLRVLPQHLRLERSRQIAIPKVKILSEFLESLRAEGIPQLF